MFRKMIAALLVLSVLCPSVPLFAHAAQAESPEQEAQLSAPAEDDASDSSASEASAQTPKDYALEASPGENTVAPPATRSVSNGTCGNELTWALDTDSGVLTISGSGAMSDFNSQSAPWYSKRSNIQSVIVEEGVTTLGVYAFQYCTALTSISLPTSLQQINTLCFQECTALSEITLPEGLTTIGYGAFNLCGLTAIHLPATLTSIELRAFYGCTALNKITIAEENPAFLVQDGVLYNKDITKLILCPGDRVEPLVIPDTVTYIESDGFSNCTKLTELTLPDGLPLVGNPFSFCNGLLNIHVYDSNPNYAEVDGVLFSKNLQNLLKFPCGRTGRYDIPNGTVVICSEAFCRMKNPMVVTMPDTVEVIASRAFSYSTGLTQITLSGGLREIYSGAFEGCTQMGNVILPETLTLLDAACFDSCRSMTEITVPAQVARVSSRAFRSCSSLKKVVLEGRVTEIGSYAFALCSALESINFPEGLTSIGANAFEQCGNLAEAQLPSTLTALGLKVFCNCSALSEIEIPQGVEVIPVSAFSGCSALAKVILPKGLLRIDSAFDDTSISQLVIPETVTEITDGAFYGCSQLSTVYFLGDAPTATKAAFRFCADTLVLCYTKDAQGWSSPSWNELPTALWSYTFSTTADCVNGGIEAFRSEDCDLVYTRRVLPYGHTFGDWYLAARPTQAAEGRWERVCSVCSYVDTEPIPALVLPEQTPAVTNNIGRQSYSVWAAPVKSYLVDNHDGTATRVEATSTDITVERYDAEKQFLSRQTLPMELPLFGGFYEGTDYFFLVFGQNNPEEDDNTEVIRVVRYTKDWLRMGQASLYGANTYIPFRAGSLRMTQYQNMLYVHTCHEMYKSIDGKHHQANLIFSVSIPEMEITDQQSRVMNAGYGYISHSFNQFVLTDGDKLLTLNHGDAYPRSAVIIQYDKPAGQTQFTGTCTYTCFLTFTGDLGDNFTGASFGAFELTDSAYLTAGNSILQDDSVALTGQRNIFLGITPRGDIGTAATSLRWITNYADGANIKVSTPHLVRIQGDRFLLLWTEDDLLRYVFVDDMGNTVSEIYEANLPLSGCKPIVWNNAVCWYMTQNSVPAFFSIPIDQPDAPQIYAPELTVTLEPDGGVLDGDTITVSYGQPYGELPVPQRKSAYQFLGWYPTKQYYYTEIDPAEQITGDTMVTAMQDHTLYAHWRFLPHTCEYEVAEIIHANCTTGKITVFACVYCDSSYRVNDGVAGHAWDEGTVTTQPTCTQPGEIAYRCTLCDATKTESIPITGHSYTVTVVAPTCTNSGYTLRTCHCGQSLKDSYTQALGHDWDEGTVTTAPTCSSSGIKTYHCTRCTETRTEVLVQTGHTYTKVITPPTCTALGYTTYTCHCGYSYIGNYTDALGHEWDEGTVTTAPTCSSSGIKTYHCTRCTETRTEVLVQTGHTYTKVITPPTCTALGYTTYTCHCGYSYIGNYTDALGHEWDEGTVTTAPTCTQRGEKTFLCTRCEATKTETVAATGHIYTEAVTPATCTAQGYTTHTCAACGN
ncbi:MAG: leucine-rich repeat protein, partial [Faecousia sp.]